jgi:hypothetical protein
LTPNSRTMARHGALGCSFSACCHRVCADVISGLLRPLLPFGLPAERRGRRRERALLFGVAPALCYWDPVHEVKRVYLRNSYHSWPTLSLGQQIWSGG